MDSESKIIKRAFNSIWLEIIQIKKEISKIVLLPGPKGKDGVNGKNGLRGEKGESGKDGKDGRDGNDGKDGKDGRDGNDGKDGKDGKDAILNIKEITKSLTDYIKENKSLSVDHINGLREELSSYRNQIAIKHGGYHGGGDTIKAGTNISLTRNTDGTVTINATGSGGAAAWGSITGTLSNQTDLQAALDAKQATLVSGTNIKTINGNSLLGSGNIVISSSTAWGSITGTLSDQTDLQTALDGKVDENAPITSATKTKITYDVKGLVTSGDDATTADIADSLNRRYVTDAQLTVIGNTSGTNTGDNAVNSLYSGLATSKQDTLVSGTNIKTVNSISLLGAGDVTINGTTNLSYTAATRVISSDTGTDATLPLFTSTEAGLVPLSGGGTDNFLRADGTWSSPAGGGGLTHPQVLARTLGS